MVSSATRVELPGTVPTGRTSPGACAVPVPEGTGGMVSAVPGTMTAGDSLEMEMALTAGAGFARAMPPPIRATAGKVAQTLRHGRAILRTPRCSPRFDMAFSLGEILLHGAPCRGNDDTRHKSRKPADQAR